MERGNQKMQGSTFANVVMLVGFVVVAIYVICKVYSQKYKK